MEQKRESPSSFSGWAFMKNVVSLKGKMVGFFRTEGRRDPPH
jgi:hypothetical protein